MVNANLGPSQDLAKRLTDLESKLAQLSTTFGSPPIGVDTASPSSTVPVTATVDTLIWSALFPYSLPNLSYIVEGTVTPGNAYLTLKAGPRGALVTIDQWNTVSSAGSLNRYHGFVGLTGPGAVTGLLSLQVTPVQAGALWQVALYCRVDSGSTAAVQSPLFQTRP